MEKNDVYLYRNSLEYARRSNEVALWRASYHANLACKEAIEAAIRQGFDGAHLSDDCVHGVLEQFGFKRVGWVLSNTIQQLYDDGRFRPDNRAWAEETYIPRDEQHNLDFVVTSHPEVLNGFVTQYRNAYQALGLFSTGDCLPNSFEELDYTGKVVVLSPDTLRESCWSPENQLWYAHDGFGCAPHAIGRSVRCTCLGDGEETRWNRTDFLGVLKEELLPDWAREKLDALQAPKEARPELTGQVMR